MPRLFRCVSGPCLMAVMAAAALSAELRPADKPADKPADAVSLVAQLGSDSYVERESAQLRLEALGESALPALRRALGSADREVALRARDAVSEIRWAGVAQRFAEIGRADSEAKVSAAVFEAAVFDLARLNQPDLDEGPFRKRLDDWGRRVRGELRGQASPVPPEAAAAALRRVLETELRFSGAAIDANDDDEFHQPINSFLPSVMDRKTGLPIVMCVLYQLVAQRAGLSVEGVGAPGRFLCKCTHADPDREVYLDPFGLRSFTRPQFAAGGGHPSDLIVSGPRATLRRMVANLENAYGRRGDRVALERLDRLNRLLAGQR